MTEKQFRDWEDYYQHEPWGEARADLRMEAYQLRLMKRVWGSEDEAPAGRWPYFPDGKKPDDIVQEGSAFDEAIEPDGKGGYRWKPGRGPQEVNANVSNDDRQT